VKVITVTLCGILVMCAAAQAETKHTDPCASKPSKWQQQQCENYHHSAPGDEYFGRMKMSYLGINNTFHDEAIRAGAYTTDPGLIARVNFADESLREWARKYPDDPQLARSYFLAVRVYEKIYTQPAQEKAWNYMHLLATRFGSTYFGKIVKADLNRGFTEHWFAAPQPCSAPGASAAAQPTADPATPAPKPGQPKVEILTPPCIAPSPSPSPA
jgi:hypothetical protein